MPHLEQKEFRADYDINKMVDNPPPGYAHIEAFFTAKNGTIYAIIPRWPATDLALHDMTASADQAKISLLHPRQELKWQTRGRDLVISIPDSLRAALPDQQAYVIEMAGVKSA